MYITYSDWFLHVMGAQQKLEDSVGLEVVVRVIDVLTEGETWLSRTGGIGGLSGSDIVHSSLTEREDWDEQYQQVATHSHCSTHEQDTDEPLQRIRCASEEPSHV